MDDGYYLAAYIDIDPLRHLSNIKMRHDHNVSLWLKTDNKVELVHYWELERITGLKEHDLPFYDKNQAIRFINHLLEPYRLTLSDMKEVWGTPKLQTCTDYHSIDDFPGYSYHSISHLFSTILSNTHLFHHENIVGMAVDAGPDILIDRNGIKKTNYVGCVVRQGKLTLMPLNSPALFWQYAKNMYRLKEGTLMALCSASNSEAWIDSELVKEVRGIDDWKYVWEALGEISQQINRFTEADKGVMFNGFDPRFTEKENKISMFVKVLQNLSFRMMEKNIEMLLENHPFSPENSYLAVSGGFALNCPTNSFLMRKYRFKGFIAPPCVNDSGQSLGIALYAFYKKTPNLHFELNHAYYGDKQNEDHYRREMQKSIHFIANRSPLQLDKVIEDIQEGPIVWFNGAAEIGPRALGNRSLLADARLERSKDLLNVIKNREWWRPVAPIILEEELNEWFEDAFPSPFMLHTFKIREEKRHIVPAISHLDGTARVQSVNKRQNQFIYEILKAYKTATQVPIICNTSLNDVGEPIINNFDQALNFALRKKLPILYFNGERIQVQNHESYQRNMPLPRLLIDYPDETTKRKLLDEHNPYRLPDNTLQQLFLRDPDRFFSLDFTKETDAQLVTRMARLVTRMERTIKKIK